MSPACSPGHGAPARELPERSRSDVAGDVPCARNLPSLTPRGAQTLRRGGRVATRIARITTVFHARSAWHDIRLRAGHGDLSRAPPSTVNPAWNDFVFEGYVNHRTEAIYFAGLLDVPESRPHSQENNRRVGR